MDGALKYACFDSSFDFKFSAPAIMNIAKASM